MAALERQRNASNSWGMVRYGFASQHPTTLFVYAHLLISGSLFRGVATAGEQSALCDVSSMPRPSLGCWVEFLIRLTEKSGFEAFLPLGERFGERAESARRTDVMREHRALWFFSSLNSHHSPAPFCNPWVNLPMNLAKPLYRTPILWLRVLLASGRDMSSGSDRTAVGGGDRPKKSGEIPASASWRAEISVCLLVGSCQWVRF